MVHQLIRKFYETGSVSNWKYNCSPTVLNSDTLEDMRLRLLQSPSISYWEISLNRRTYH